MSDLAIICIEDEQEVLDAVMNDLDIFEDNFIIEGFTSAEQSREFLNALPDKNIRVALFICDHLMPGVTGVDFLVSLAGNDDLKGAKKMLLTGQAGLEDTVKAINQGDLDYYVAKPWKREELVQSVRSLLTDFVLEQVPDVLPFMMVLDGEKISEGLRKRGNITDR